MHHFVGNDTVIVKGSLPPSGNLAGKIGHIDLQQDIAGLYQDYHQSDQLLAACLRRH
jgi:hypothetical protein